MMKFRWKWRIIGKTKIWHESNLFHTKKHESKYAFVKVERKFKINSPTVTKTRENGSSDFDDKKKKHVKNLIQKTTIIATCDDDIAHFIQSPCSILKERIYLRYIKLYR
jgi:hypothetical protein